MKTRVTITLDPDVVRRAKAVARNRRTNLSALVEELLRQSSAEAATQPAGSFAARWAGKLEPRSPEPSNDLLTALRRRHGLSGE